MGDPFRTEIIHRILLCILAAVITYYVTKNLVNKCWELDSIQQGNGYYNSATGLFQWNSSG